MTELHWLGAAELAQGYRAGRFSPVEAVEACLARIEELGERLGVFAVVDRVGALAAAEASARRWRQSVPLGPADGVPATVKDLITVAGWPCRRGSHATADRPAERDAPAVASLRAAGAILLGATTTPEFGWKAVTDNPRGDIARNPHDPAMTAGGSSGGAAVAAATGMGAWHLGTDGGGSIRIPAAFCGIFGLKPSFGRVPALPLSPFGTVAHLGPMTRCVADAAAMLEVMARPEARDWHNLPPLPADPFAELEAGIAGWRVAASRDLGHLDVQPEIAQAFEAALASVTRAGAEIVRVDPPVPPVAGLFETHWHAGAANLVAGVEPGLLAGIDAGLREIAAAGMALDGAALRGAAIARSKLGEAMQGFLIDHDLLLTPSTTLPAFAAGHEVPPGSGLARWTDWAGLSHLFNLTQQPAASLPCGRTAAGLPVGLQLVAAKYREDKVLRAARALETAGLGFVAPPALPAAGRQP